MPKIGSWLFWNSVLVSGLIDTVLVAFLGGIIIAYLADRWQERRKRHEFQFGVFRRLLRATARIGNGYSALYDAIKREDRSQIDFARKRARKSDEELDESDLEILAAFKYPAVSDDVSAIKALTTRLAKAAEASVQYEDFIAIQGRFIRRSRMTHFRLMREMGMLSKKRYRQAAERLEKVDDAEKNSDS